VRRATEPVGVGGFEICCKRSGKLGYAEREDRRTCQLIVIPPKKVLKAARA
jgi:hypothetical protein